MNDDIRPTAPLPPSAAEALSRLGGAFAPVLAEQLHIERIVAGLGVGESAVVNGTVCTRVSLAEADLLDRYRKASVRMNDDIRGLLTAVLEALDIPHPATIGDTQVHGEVLAARAIDTVTALRGVLEHGDGPGWSADYLRERLAGHPPTGYRAWGEDR